METAAAVRALSTFAAKTEGEIEGRFDLSFTKVY